MTRRTRLAVVVSHPIQYYAPYYRALVERGGIELRAFFASRIGLDRTFDPGMGTELAWATDLLSGYDFEFLENAENIKRASFRDIDNPRVGKALARFEPDAVLTHGYTQITLFRALAWSRLKGTPALMISDSSLHSGTPSALRLAKRLVLPQVFRQFSAFLSIGDASQRYFETFGVPRSRIFRVPNVVDAKFWALRARREEERRRLRAELGFDERDFVVLFSGKLIERKRPADLLAAVARLGGDATARPIKLVLAGDGVLRDALEAEAKRLGVAATFAGFVNIDALPAYYCAADALAHPAEIETFGVVVLEAAILGLPLVLSDRVGAIGPTSIARPGENSLTYPCGDVPALSQALRRLADEPETAARLAAASLRISEELDERKAVSGTLAALDYCLAGKRPI